MRAGLAQNLDSLAHMAAALGRKPKPRPALLGPKFAHPLSKKELRPVRYNIFKVEMVGMWKAIDVWGVKDPTCRHLNGSLTAYGETSEGRPLGIQFHHKPIWFDFYQACLPGVLVLSYPTTPQDIVGAEVAIWLQSTQGQPKDSYAFITADEYTVKGP